jgi:hypothetical protein
MKEQSEDILKIEVTGRTVDTVPFDSFLELARNTLSILQDLDASISQSENASLEWEIIGASLNSPMMLTIKGHSDIGIDISEDVIRAYLTGVEQVDKGSEVMPPYFTADTLRKTRDMVNVLNDGIKKVAFSSPKSVPVVPSKKVIENVAVILEAQELEESNNVVELHAHRHSTKEEQATITGTLETVTVHGKKPKFVIYDPLTSNRIDCFFQEEKLEEIKSLLPSRVSVTGTAKHNKQGHPTSIEVETFKKLRSKGELPSFKDLEGINFSGELDPTEYVRRLRNG